MNRHRIHAISGMQSPLAGRAALLALLLCIVFVSSWRVSAQNVETIKDNTPTFLEHQLALRRPTLNVLWTWNKVEGRPYVYRIEIKSPTSWVAAHLCIDGRLAKTIPPSTDHFEWSIQALPVGKHTASLLITDNDGNFGVAYRPVRVR